MYRNALKIGVNTDKESSHKENTLKAVTRKEKKNRSSFYKNVSAQYITYLVLHKNISRMHSAHHLRKNHKSFHH